MYPFVICSQILQQYNNDASTLLSLRKEIWLSAFDRYAVKQVNQNTVQCNLIYLCFSHQSECGTVLLEQA